MNRSSIPVDVLNPGQVFACLGLLEAAETLLGEARAAFDWSRPHDVGFHLEAAGSEGPVQYVLAFLAEATVSAEAPAHSNNSTDKWSVPTRVLEYGAAFPFPDPDSPATLPAVLEARGQRLVLDYWGDGADVTGRDNVKFWGGSGGYPGAALARDALDKVRGRCPESAGDPFQLAAPQSSSFRLDWRRDYIPIDAGFSLNKLKGTLVPMGYPLVEILAALGLKHARPRRHDRLKYHYEILGTSGENSLYPPLLMRAALGGSDLPFPRRRFRMHLGEPDQKSRAITRTTEEAIV